MTVVSHMESPLNIVRNQQRLGVFPACEKRRVNVTDGDRCVHSGKPYTSCNASSCMLTAFYALDSWVAMWKTAQGTIEQAHWETHHEVGGVYHEVHIGQPAGGRPDPCQKAHEGHLL